jgi:hypothetical protein
MSAPIAEGATRSCGDATSEELRLAPMLGAWAHPPMARIRLLPSIESAGRQLELRHRQSRAALGPTATHRTRSRPDGGPRVSTTTTTTTRATTTIVGADGGTTVTMIATVAGHQTSGVHGPLDGASAMRSFLRVSGIRPTYQDMTGTPTLAYGSRATGLHAMRGSDRRPVHHQEPAALPR